MKLYEGSEKKCEVIVDSRYQNLRNLPRNFWQRMIECCGATILSTVHNSVCDAYLLSESSLFVWDDRFLLITCGRTQLIEAVLFFFEEKGTENILQLRFYRKNEYFSELQYSDFDQDVQRLNKRLEGKTTIVGDLAGHFTKIFYFARESLSIKPEQTSELFMYDISEQASTFLLRPDHSKEDLQDFFRISEIIPQFEIDDFTFQPCGYSLNAIHKHQYLTIHVTPQPEHSYVSLETNIPLQQILEHAIARVKPSCFDVIIHQLNEEARLALKQSDLYQEVNQQTQTLDCGYTVHFYHRRAVDN